MNEFYERLKAPFREEEIEWRLAQCGKTNSGFWGKCLAYITARAIMDRLDEVVGLENWKVSYRFISDSKQDEKKGNSSGVIAELSLRINGEWVTKEDGSEQTDIESFKGGLSSALKRAAVTWGMGRYLYNLDEGFVQVVDKGTRGSHYGQTKDRETFYWLPPKLPEWALPKKDSGKKIEAAQSRAPGNVERDALAKLAISHRWSTDLVLKFIQHQYGVNSLSQMNMDQYTAVCRIVSSMSFADAMKPKEAS